MILKPDQLPSQERRPMNIFKGLTEKQAEVIRHISERQTCYPGDIIFSEGDTASDGLYIVTAGLVQIYRRTLEGDLEVARLGPGNTFGEMGLLNSGFLRTASAKAVENTRLMRLTSDPIALCKNIGDPIAGIALLHNLIAILSQRLRAKDDPEWIPLQHRTTPYFLSVGADPHAPFEKLSELLPQSFLRKMMGEKKLAVGEYLVRQGDRPEGLFIIHKGVLKSEKTLPDGTIHSPGNLIGPTIAGEIGCILNEQRSSSLVAQTEVLYDFFSSKDFQKLEKKNPEEAFDLLFAVAQLVVCLILDRENG